MITSILLVGVLGYATYGHIDESYDYNYGVSGNEIEEITLDTDICDVEIKYNETIMPTNISMMIGLEIHLEGIFMEGKSYNDYFEPLKTVNNSLTKSLILRTRPNVWYNPSFWFTKGNIKLIATLRTDLKYNITTMVSTGNINLITTENQTFDNIYMSTSTGNINIFSSGSKFIEDVVISTSTGSIMINSENTDFLEDINIGSSTGNIFCTQNNGAFGGNVQISVLTGNIHFELNNLTNYDNNIWDIATLTGNINILIDQNMDLEGNIQGNIGTSTGNIRVNYYDNNSKISGRFIGSVSTGNIAYTNNNGFIQENNSFRSLDFPTAQFSYDFILHTNTGNILIIGSSS
ncbi:MAG: hypothetical protein KGD63_06530 [Candidatus Lokiarchaeota archaeon]|nr:hypothetical protein [Candidatus Lokiarchaeota archaeon]